MFVRNLILVLTFLVIGCSQPKATSSLDNSGAGVIGGAVVRDENLKLATVAVYMVGGDCSGSYIGNNKVVTASHCIADGDAVAVEFNHLEGKFSCKVEKGVMNPNYMSSDEAVWYDVAVLTIQCDDERIKDVKPFSLSKDLNPSASINGAGYGLSSQFGGFTFPQLNNMELKAANMEAFLSDPNMSKESLQEIKDLLPKIQAGMVSCYQVDINKTMFFGDSGGPTYYKGTNSYVLYSVNDALYTKTQEIDSLYAFCGTNISFHRDWILQQ